MRAISIQIQPDRSPGIDMAGLLEAFRSLTDRTDLVLRHSFDHGSDRREYYNFTFGTERPGALWRSIQETIFQAPEYAEHMAAASMAMCSSENGWGDYVQLYHWDPEVSVVPASAL